MQLNIFAVRQCQNLIKSHSSFEQRLIHFKEAKILFGEINRVERRQFLRGGSRGRVQGVRFIGVEVEQETSAPPPKKTPGSAPVSIATMLSPQKKSKMMNNST